MADVTATTTTRLTEDERIDLFARCTDAHTQALAAGAALRFLVLLIVNGELDPGIDDDMDTLTVFAAGIGSRIDEVAEALDAIIHSGVMK